MNLKPLLFVIFLYSCEKLVDDKSNLQSVANHKTVEVIKPSNKPFFEILNVVGLVTPKQLSSVHFLTEGKVETCAAVPGDFVKMGQEICRLDGTLVSLELARASAAVQSATRALDLEFLKKQRSLFDAGVIGQVEYEKIRIEAEKAENMLNEAKSALSMLKKKQELLVLRAPFSGKILEIKTQRGMPINPALPAAVISSSEALVIKADVPARYYRKIENGRKFFLKSIAGEAYVLEKQELLPIVVSKSAGVSPEKQSFTAEIAGFSDEMRKRLVPGAMVSGDLELDHFPSSTTIPFLSLIQWDSQTQLGTVYVVDGNSRIRAKKVETSAPHGEFIHVKNGLKNEENIVYPVPSFLEEGDKAEVYTHEESR